MPMKLILVSVFINRMTYPCCIPALSLTLDTALIVICYPLDAEGFNFAAHEYVIKNKT